MTYTGLAARVGAQYCLNAITGESLTVVQGTAPTWVPGMNWVDSSSSYTVKKWNGSAWVADTGARYLALLTADPTVLPATSISQLSEVTTAGYSRQLVTFEAATNAFPTVTTNTGTITWGPMSADMLLPAEWLALVDVASGTAGQFLYSWGIPTQLVSDTESVMLATDGLTLDQG